MQQRYKTEAVQMTVNRRPEISIMTTHQDSEWRPVLRRPRARHFFWSRGLENMLISSEEVAAD